VNYELLIARKIVSGKDKGNVSKPIVAIAIGGVALGIAVIIVAVAIVTGFQLEIRNKVIGFGGHIEVSNFDSNHSEESAPVTFDKKLYDNLKKTKGVQHVQTYAIKTGIIKTDEYFEGAVLKGVGSDYDWSFFKSKMIEGRWFDVSDKGRQKDIVISKYLAKKLKLKLGQKMFMYFINKDVRAVMDFHITGIYETGLEEFDKQYVIGDIGQIKRLNGWKPDETGGYEIFINDFDDLDKAKQEVNETVGFDYSNPLKVRTIKDDHPQIFDWLGLQNINVIVIIALMLLVAGINMISALLIIILERTNLIGTLKALGAADWSIRKIFLYTAAYLVGFGMLIGNVIGIVLCQLQIHYKLFKLDQSSYYIPYVPINFNLAHLLLINIGTLVICVSMLIIPSMIIARITPVKAIRFN
jgi:lipoprotein-releasing system permease protein